MVPGREPRERRARDALPPPASSAARAAAPGDRLSAGLRRRRNAGGDVCKLGLKEIYGIFRLHRFAGVPTPGSVGWWLVGSGTEAEGWKGRVVSTPFRGFIQKEKNQHFDRKYLTAENRTNIAVWSNVFAFSGIPHFLHPYLALSLLLLTEVVWLKHFQFFSSTEIGTTKLSWDLVVWWLFFVGFFCTRGNFHCDLEVI